MKNTADHIEDFFNQSREYAKISLHLYKLQAVNAGTEIASRTVLSAVLALIAAIFTLLFTIGLSIYIGEQLQSYPAGFLIMSLVYLVLGAILVLFREKLILNPVANYLIEKTLHNGKNKTRFTSNTDRYEI